MKIGVFLLLGVGAMGPVMMALDLPSELKPVPVATGFTSLEGPAWSDREQCLYFSNQREPFGLFRYVPEDGSSLVYAYEGKVNGNVVLEDGALVTCESGNHQVVRRSSEGEWTVLVKDLEGQPLNQPNDVVARRDGALWFTTPNWPSNDRQYVVAYDPRKSGARIAVAGIAKPNGLGFSPDEKMLYVIDSDGNQILRHPVNADGSVGPGETWVANLGGNPDGMTVDHLGNVYACVWDDRHPEGGLHIISPSGDRLAHLPIPGNTTNCAFGGPHRQQLYITSGDTLYLLDLAEVYPIERPQVSVQRIRTRDADGAILQWEAVPGQRYWIEVSTNGENWERVTESIQTIAPGKILLSLPPDSDAHSFRVHPVWDQ